MARPSSATWASPRMYRLHPRPWPPPAGQELLPRLHRGRRAPGQDGAELNRLVEDPLLNLDGTERITYAEEGISQQGIVSFGGAKAAGADDTAIFDFRTDLKKALILDLRKKAGVGLALQTARKVSDNFARGMAGPGRQAVMEARPDAP